MLGRTISHYRIVSQIGAGGMGVVYAAEDHRLGRPVALKFVPEDLAKDQQAIERLKSEARTASGLNHANICTIYDIDEYEGRPFIVMELLKGQTLRDRLTEGPLRIHQIIDLGIQVADALDSAHRRDVIHRDIKPANLFLIERGQVKILDFGLAKLLSRRPASMTITVPETDLTSTGVTLGTVAYMSPEQVAGEQLDGRTDLFSLGVVLYECVTGHQPFTGRTSAIVLAAILNRPPVAPVVFNPELPPRLQEVMNNCLEKDRELRYQDAAGLRADLKRIKRDLESGHSGVLRMAGPFAPAAPVAVAGGSHASLPIESVTEADTSRPRAHGTKHDGARGVRFGTAAMAIAVATVVLAAAASYWVSRRTPAPDVARGASEAIGHRALDLATTSFRTKDYRAALAHSEEALQALPDQEEAIRIRDTARAMVARFDEAVAKATGLLASGDTDGATRALDTARSIDPAAPAVTALSTQLVNRLKIEVDAARKGAQASRQAPAPSPLPQPQASVESARPQIPRQSAAEALSLRPRSPREAPTPTTAASAPSSAPAPNIRPANPEPPAAAATPAVTEPVSRGPAPRTGQPAAAPELPSARDASASVTPPGESDESAIRRTVATYARAIETKDVALFRSIKPNLTSEEQRRIEESFRAVSLQQVSITILSIDRRGQEASVRLRRRDTIDAGGRQQTAESQQTLTLTRTSAGWVIAEIGR